jgi:hypothetical protein
MFSRLLLVSLYFVPLAGFAQGSTPQSHTAPPEQFESADGAHKGLSNVPGYTGTTVLRGNNSTQAGDAKATKEQQKGPIVK